MQRRKGISPFIATVLLVAITITIGGVLYTQFRQTITSEIRTPSMSLVDVNVSDDRQTITMLLKNDGNVQFTVSRIIFSFGQTTQSFVLGINASLISGTGSLPPGSLFSAKFKPTGITLPNFSTFTLTVAADQLGRAFTVQA
jgi:flagellin-like protein